MPDLSKLDRSTARRIIDSLKSGTTPLESVGYLDVGRDLWYRGMKYYLEGAIDGESKVRFIKGFYGDGKTHLMAMARHFALEDNFVVSYSSAENMRLDKFEEVYKRIIRQLETAEGSGGIAFILRRWKALVTEDEISDLRYVEDLDLNFRLAIEGYLRATETTEEDQIVQWLLGEPVQLRGLGINRQLRPGDSRDMMRSLSILLRHIGYSGLVVLVDELDRIQNLSSRQRQNCYQVLRELMDNADGQGGMQGTLFYCAAPPEMFISDRGFSEYDALRTRMSSVIDRGDDGLGVDYRSTIIDLERTPLQPDDYYKMAQQVLSIYSHAFPDWDYATAFPDEELRRIVNHIMEEARPYSMSKPRLVSMSLATLFDLAEQGQAYDVPGLVERSAQQAQHIQKESVHKKYED